MPPRDPTHEPSPGSRLVLLGAEAKVVLPDRRVATRELLQVDLERRFELRVPGAPGMAILDVGPGVLNATLVGAPRTSLEVEFLVVGLVPLVLDAWCSLGAHCSTEVTIADGFGRLVVPDLTARDPSAAPINLTSGRYLLLADAHQAPLALRMAQAISVNAIRAAI